MLQLYIKQHKMCKMLWITHENIGFLGILAPLTLTNADKSDILLTNIKFSFSLKKIN